MSHVCINHARLNLTCGLGLRFNSGLNGQHSNDSKVQESTTKPLVVLQTHVLLDVPIILSSPCSHTYNTAQAPEGMKPDKGIEESIKAPAAMS